MTKLTREKRLEKIMMIIVEIAHTVNLKQELDKTLVMILKLLQDFLNTHAAFICLHDTTSRRFQLSSQMGLRIDPKEVFCYPKTKQHCKKLCFTKCLDCYTGYSVSCEDISPEAMYESETFVNDRCGNMCLVHIPILSSDEILGILHVLLPEAYKKIYLDETHVFCLIAGEIGAVIKRKQLEKELQQYAEDLEKTITRRTDELREKDAQLVQSGKLATLGEMSTGIAHEINQPLGVISLIVQGLQRAKDVGKLSDAMLDDKLNAIHGQVDRIDKIIQHLRAFGRNESKFMEKISINKPLKDVMELIGRHLENHCISVEFHLDPILYVVADANRLEQVFLNIIGNARDALDEHEKAVSQFKVMNNPPSWVLNWTKKIILRSYRNGNRVIVEIEDTAGGIPMHILDRLFDPFFTTKEVGKGTGLGLTISYGIIRDLGGDIKVKTNPGVGSVFSVILPSVAE